MRITRFFLSLSIGLLIIILAACQRSASQDNAATTLDPLYTQQALTVAALSTVAAKTPIQPTPIMVNTPVGTLPAQPTPISATPIPGGQSGICDAAQYVADVTVPDDMAMTPGFAFTKTWRLKNVGTCTWNTGYKVDFASGDPMSAVFPVNLTQTVTPGQTVDVSVNMVSPSTAGTYQGNWKLRNASGLLFGIGPSAGDPFFVRIVVSGTPGSCTDLATYVADVTVPDNMVFNPNTAFTKTWRLKNSGTCTWTPDYVLTYVSGDPMSAVYPVKLTSSITPGSNVDLSANMVAPTTNGTYKGNWSLKNPSGRTFGLGTNGDIPFWVQIVVGSGSSGAGPTPVPGACLNKASFVADVSVPDNTVFAPNTAFTKTWRLKNIGSCTWTTDYSATYVSGDPMSAVYPVKLTSNVAPSQTVDISANMVAPATAGVVRGNWNLKSSTGQLFALGTNANVPFYVQIVVSGSVP
jgi:Ig-like domain from next to BRCA1 gene